MYITNNRSKRNKHSKYNISDFPANYSGQYTEDSVRHGINSIIEISSDISDIGEFDMRTDNYNPDGRKANRDAGDRDKDGDREKEHKSELHKASETKAALSHTEPKSEHHERKNEHKHDKHEEKKDHSHSLIGSLLHGKDKGGGGGILSSLLGKKNESGGILSSIDIEDLILIAVIFFLLKDGVEDDFLIILALILFA